MNNPAAARRRLRCWSIVRSATLAGVVSGALGAQTSPAPSLPLRYPPTPRGAQADDLSGVHVADPYRWLEAVGSPDVHGWMMAEDAVTESYLAEVPRRAELADRVRRFALYPKLRAPFGGGERLFYYENSGLENQPALYVQDRRDTPARVLIDPNAFSHDGLIAIVDEAASPDGKYLAYAVTTEGSAWRDVRVRDVRSGQDLSDELHGIKKSPLSWTRDERGFFYVRSDAATSGPTNPIAPDGRQRVYYHRVGQRQSDDRLMYEAADHPDWRLRADVSEDGQYLVIAARPGAGTELANRLYFIDLDNPKRPNLGAPLVKLFDGGDALYEFISSDGPLFFIRTTKDAPRARVVAVDINSPDPDHWTTVVRETYDPLVGALRVDDRIIAHRLHDAHSVLELYSFDGGARGVVPLPGAGIGTVSEINGRSDNREFYFTYSSVLQPPSVYRYDLDGKSAISYRSARPDTALAQFETTQLFYTSKDGTRVPLFITARRGIALDGTHPTLLSGEGAFQVSSTPTYSPFVAAWLESGGVYAVADVRGGGEYGRAWHEAAVGAHKQTSIDDFIAAAEFLVDQRYTRPSLLAIGGRGNGGLLVGAAMTQRPGYFAAALIDAGLLDMVRFTRFTGGGAWTREYGSPDNPTDLRALLAYSPLHQLKRGTIYPATLVTVGDHDEVFTPAHSNKFVAALQASQAGTSPVLLRVISNAGFGPGTPLGKELAIDADRLAFLSGALHLAR
ncbi:MAG: prolyl oligopeptidase family serine peptidase [Deltaproteobacteria bacterium]